MCVLTAEVPVQEKHIATSLPSPFQGSTLAQCLNRGAEHSSSNEKPRKALIAGVMWEIMEEGGHS